MSAVADLGGPRGAKETPEGRDFFSYLVCIFSVILRARFLHVYHDNMFLCFPHFLFPFLLLSLIVFL